jgi:hypothetical protein
MCFCIVGCLLERHIRSGARAWSLSWRIVRLVWEKSRWRLLVKEGAIRSVVAVLYLWEHARRVRPAYNCKMVWTMQPRKNACDTAELYFQNMYKYFYHLHCFSCVNQLAHLLCSRSIQPWANVPKILRGNWFMCARVLRQFRMLEGGLAIAMMVWGYVSVSVSGIHTKYRLEHRNVHPCEYTGFSSVVSEWIAKLTVIDLCLLRVEQCIFVRDLRCHYPWSRNHEAWRTFTALRCSIPSFPLHSRTAIWLPQHATSILA